jgi:hypothetical protein
VYSSGLGLGPGVSSCEHGSEPSGSIRAGSVTDHLMDYQLLKKVCAP